MKGVILAGGFGKRLRPLTDSKPKPLIRVSGVPILLWQLNWLREHGIDDVVICAGYLKERIVNYIGDGDRFGVNAEYAIEETPLGTGGALKNAKNLLEGEESFVMLNGDILTNLDPQELYKRVDGRAEAAIAVVPLPSPYGIIDIEEDDTIRGFREKPLLEGYWINAGAYCLSSSILDDLPDKGNIETTTFPKLAETGAIKAVRYRDAFWRSIDSHKDIEEAARELKSELDVIAKKFHITRRKSDSA
ncbi:MAG: NDP-sugar synthase [Nitrososphaerales archaeon]